MMQLRGNNQGAALIVAVALLVVLLMLGLTFVSLSRMDLIAATSLRDAMQTKLLSDAGVALAESFLRHDLEVHPTFSSLDHAWRTYFNGAWFARKTWAQEDGHSPYHVDAGGDAGVPRVTWEQVNQLDSLDDLYIPRINDTSIPVSRADYEDDEARTPSSRLFDFAVPDPDATSGTAPALYDAAAVDQWADVDTDGDGYRDAIWIPMAATRPADDDYIDNNLNGWVDEGPGLAYDGKDNDWDGTVDNVEEALFPPDGIDNDKDGDVDEAGEQNEVPARETAPFVYYDEINDRIWLTAPIRKPDGSLLNNIEPRTLNPSTGIRLASSPYGPLDSSDPSDCDTADNDWDFVVNNSGAYVFTMPNLATAMGPSDYARERARSYHVIAPCYTGGSGTVYGTGDEVVTSTGEPVSDIVGRIAVHITDESSKLDLNTAHAMVRREAPDADSASPSGLAQDNEGPIQRSLADGIGPGELDLRPLPDLGIALSSHIAALRGGAPDGIGLSVNYIQSTSRLSLYSAADAEEAISYYDLTMPGYGLSDDNGDAFWLAFNGLDDDGNGFVDDGLYPYDYDGDDTVEYGWLEGIDDPFEMQMFRPLRNAVFENDGEDNDENGVVDEIGEYGDHYYHTREQIKLIDGIAGTIHTRLRNLLTAHSWQRNERFQYYSDWDTPVEPPVHTGLKLDYNYASPDQVAHMLKNDWGYQPRALDTDVPDDNEAFAAGLRLEGVEYRTEVLPGARGLLGLTATSTGERLGIEYLPPDPELRAHQLGVDIVDQRDLDHARTETTYTVDDAWAVARDIEHQEADAAYEAFEEAQDTIEYTTAGVEAIRINEIMVRATRRIEAESFKWNRFLAGGEYDYAAQAEDLALYPSNFDYLQFYVNTFSPTNDLDGYADFDVTKAAIPISRIFAASASGDIEFDPIFIEPAPIAGEDVWYARNDLSGVPYNGLDGFDSSSTIDPRGFPLSHSITIMGRSNEDAFYGDGNGNDVPAPPHAGPESYLAFQAPVLNPNELSDGFTDYKVSAATVKVADLWVEWPIGSGTYEILGHEVPNLVQYRFGPGPGLPPGRYYLLINTTTNGNADTATIKIGQEDKLQYAIKYGTWNEDRTDNANEEIIKDVLDLGGTGWFVDLLGGAEVDTNPLTGNPVIHAIDGSGVVFDSAVEPDVVVGTRRDTTSTEVETGYALLKGLASPGTSASSYTDAYCETDEFYAYTVVIPEYADDPADQEYLYLALWKNPTYADEDLAINWFEFSQEPDHEWVELVNTSGETVDVSGWELEVGSAGAAGEDTDHALLTIPDGDPDFPDDAIRIAPGGSLLLALNKYDVGADQFTSSDWMHRNGIGLCATGSTSILPIFGLASSAMGKTITIPPFPTVDPRNGSNRNLPLGESVFYRMSVATSDDLIDRNGDGEADTEPTEDDTVVSSFPDDLPPGYESLFPTKDDPDDPSASPRKIWDLPEPGKKPWDRIVELECTRLGAGMEMYTLVLAGGIFPNYPDEDWTDSDGDAVTLSRDGVDNNGNNELLANNGNNDDGDGDTDEADEGIDEPYEGIDEGRYFRDQRRAAYPDSGETPLAVPGGWMADQVVYRYDTDSGVQAVTGGYLGEAGDPVEWKEFVERRFFPGDCVVISLRDQRGNLVDRVTYTQRDVENRAADDHFSCGYVAENGDSAALYGTQNLGMWPDNTMGVDFYRALERKHPFYTGDRFGTRNRWQATDGNYDDWDSAQGPTIEYLIESSGFRGFVLWDADLDLLAHSVSGSPLRDNLFKRGLEDPGQFNTWDPERVRHNAILLPDYHFDRTVVRNDSYSSPGELVRMPYFVMTKEIGQANTSSAGPVTIENPDQVLLGRGSQDELRDLDALLTSGAHSAIVLTCGQASFYPLHPSADFLKAGDNEKFIQWVVGSGSTDDQLPQGWTPIFLYDLDDTSDPDLWTTPPRIIPFGPTEAPAELNFLFQPPTRLPEGFTDLASLYGVLNDLTVPREQRRWPIEERAVMYVSANPAGFEPSQAQPYEYLASPTEDDPAEALFEWDGADGVENGEYDVYVVTVDNLERLRALAAADAERIREGTGDPLLSYYDNDDTDPLVSTRFDAFALLKATGTDVDIDDDPAEQLRISTADLGVDVEIFTDRDGNHRCWSGMDRPRTDLLLRTGESSESFGRRSAEQPTTEGYIYYGTVTVENNYLALFLRNWAKGGTLNRFSRVILAPRHREPGRINLNTASLQYLDTDDNGSPDEEYCPLTTIPGVLKRNFQQVGTIWRLYAPYDYELLPASSDYIQEGLDKSERILLNRPRHLDARYYESSSQLLTRDVNANPEITLDETLVYDTDGSPFTEEEKYEEKALRYSELANLVATRSGVFEILVVAQTGSISSEDLNGDSRIDYRNDFIVQGEHRSRTIYEP